MPPCFFFNFIYLFYLLWAVLGLCCYRDFSLVVASGGYSLFVLLGLLISVAALAAEHRLWAVGSVVAGCELSSCGSRALWYRGLVAP